jgi:hypothetical protein
VAAFRERLNKVAGFEFVPEPMPMINRRNAAIITCFSRRPSRSRKTSSPTFSKRIGGNIDLP